MRDCQSKMFFGNPNNQLHEMCSNLVLFSRGCVRAQIRSDLSFPPVFRKGELLKKKSFQESRATGLKEMCKPKPAQLVAQTSVSLKTWLMKVIEYNHFLWLTRTVWKCCIQFPRYIFNTEIKWKINFNQSYFVKKFSMYKSSSLDEQQFFILALKMGRNN